MLKVILILINFLAVSCSSQSVVKLKSVPEGASVTVSSQDGSVKSLGKTPLELSSNELGGGRFSSINLSKEGHKDHHIVLGKDRGNENYDIVVKLTAEAENPKLVDSRARQEKLAKLLLKAHSLTSSKKYSEAEDVLGSLVLDYPHISAGYDLLGNVAYLQKDLKKALNHYQRSLELNPENVETRQMVSRLQNMMQ